MQTTDIEKIILEVGQVRDGAFDGCIQDLRDRIVAMCFSLYNETTLPSCVSVLRPTHEHSKDLKAAYAGQGLACLENQEFGVECCQ